MFNKRLNPEGEKLEKYQTVFEKLSIAEQVEILLQILRLTSTNRKTEADLTLIGGSAHEGTLKLSKNLTRFAKDQVKNGQIPKILLINQSPSGLFESEIDLLTV